jgi:tRNA uridine 5-carboxymethylaminomethyl modification enzyme
MFTSRAEYRLSLRADNADRRLTPIAERLGLAGAARSRIFAAKSRQLQEARTLLESLNLTPNEAAEFGMHLNRDGVRRTAFDLLSRPDIDFVRLAAVWPQLTELDRFVAEQIEIDARYAVYLERQSTDIEAFKRDEGVALPEELEYGRLAGLSNEVREKLEAARPATLGQAARIEGMTPAALTLVLAEATRCGAGRRNVA